MAFMYNFGRRKADKPTAAATAIVIAQSNLSLPPLRIKAFCQL